MGQSPSIPESRRQASSSWRGGKLTVPQGQLQGSERVYLSQWSINQEQDSIGNMQLGFRIFCFALVLVLSNPEFPGLVAAWHPSYLGGGGRRISSSNPV